jgi:hypothetical protein
VSNTEDGPDTVEIDIDHATYETLKRLAADAEMDIVDFIRERLLGMEPPTPTA